MSKTWLNKLILTIITIFTSLTVLVAIFYIGYVIVLEDLKTQLASSNEELKTRSEKVADFSKIPPGYTVTKALDITGIKIVLVNYPYSGQILGIADPGWLLNINKKDASIDNLEEQLRGLISAFNKQHKLRIEDFVVEKKDSFKSVEQSIPYIKVFFTTEGEHKGEYKGIIGIINNPYTKKNMLIFSYNAPVDYRQITTERFFQNINFGEPKR